MMHYFETIKKSPLFAGIAEPALQKLLPCLSATLKHYEKGCFIWHADEAVTAVGVVLTGCAHIVKDDYWGRRALLAGINPGDLFAEAFVCAEIQKLPVSVIAAEQTTVLLIDYKKIITTCPSACTFHTGLIKNMLRILAGRNVMLTQKIEHLTRGTTREKVLSYLSSAALQAQSRRFTIPFNRQELADYLSVDRSALSYTLSQMRDEGLIHFHRNQFELIDPV